MGPSFQQHTIFDVHSMNLNKWQRQRQQRRLCFSLLMFMVRVTTFSIAYYFILLLYIQIQKEMAKKNAQCAKSNHSSQRIE